MHSSAAGKGEEPYAVETCAAVNLGGVGLHQNTVLLAKAAKASAVAVEAAVEVAAEAGVLRKTLGQHIIYITRRMLGGICMQLVRTAQLGMVTSLWHGGGSMVGLHSVALLDLVAETLVANA